MHSKPENASSIEPEGQGDQPATICSQPWWHGIGCSVVPPAVLPENSSKFSPLEMTEQGMGTKTKAGQPQMDVGRDEGGNVSKEVRSLNAKSGLSLSLSHEL